MREHPDRTAFLIKTAPRSAIPYKTSKNFQSLFL